MCKILKAPYSFLVFAGSFRACRTVAQCLHKGEGGHEPLKKIRSQLILKWKLENFLTASESKGPKSY